MISWNVDKYMWKWNTNNKIEKVEKGLVQLSQNKKGKKPNVLFHFFVLREQHAFGEIINVFKFKSHNACLRSIYFDTDPNLGSVSRSGSGSISKYVSPSFSNIIYE